MEALILPNPKDSFPETLPDSPQATTSTSRSIRDGTEDVGTEVKARQQSEEAWEG